MNECDDAVLPAHSTEDMGQHVHFFPSRSLYTDVWAKNEQSTNPVIHTNTPSLSHSFIFSHTHTHTWARRSRPWRCTASSPVRVSKWPGQPGPPRLWRSEGRTQTCCWPWGLPRSASSPGCWPAGQTQMSTPQCAAGPSRWGLDCDVEKVNVLA